MPAILITKLTTKEFIKRARKVHGNKYNYSLFKYVNAITKGKMKCQKCNDIFEQNYVHHVIRKHGCPNCAGNKRLTTNTFITKSRLIHGKKYNYSKVNYKNNSSKVIIICPKHGEFLQRPGNHINIKNGCPTCYDEKRYNTKGFISKSKKIHNNIYDYSLVKNITNATTKIKIICKKCKNIFWQSPFNHLIGKCGCPECKKSNGESLIAKILKENKINYVKQKIFKDCINPKTGHWLSYDFYLPEQKTLIEYNGMQHYKYIKYYHKHGKTLLSQQYRDSIKKQYALSHGYKFLVIKYSNKNIKKTLTDALSNPASLP